MMTYRAGVRLVMQGFFVGLAYLLHFPRKPELPKLTSAEISALDLAVGESEQEPRKQRGCADPTAGGPTQAGRCSGVA